MATKQQIQAGTMLTCEACNARFRVEQPCTCEATQQNMICSCGMPLQQMGQSSQQR